MNKGFKFGLYLFASLLVHLSVVAQTDTPKASATNLNVPRIEWDRGTLSLIQSNGYYARIIRLKSGQMLCGFDFERKISVRHSDDEGKTWNELVKVAESPFSRLTNVELLQLRNGTILCFYNERPRRSAPENSSNVVQHHYNIGMARSEDGGKTWQKSETLYTAGTEFTNGCWEPAAIELPSGEVQMFFSNEGPYRQSDEQEITLRRSKDGARTWSSPEKVSFRSMHRDGMVVPLILKNNLGIVFAIEDNGLSGHFKPAIIFTTLKDNWRSGTREPGNTNRWSALRTLPPPQVSVSAPYLRQIPSGETLLSVQQSETGEMKTAYMKVYIGDANARDFNSPSTPFPITAGTAQLWNSLFIKDSETVVAVTESTINGVSGIWSIDGRFVRNNRE